MRPLAKCPVCGDTSLLAIRAATKHTTGYRCSKGHVLEMTLRGVDQAKQLRAKARVIRIDAQRNRAKADQRMERARELRRKLS